MSISAWDSSFDAFSCLDYGSLMSHSRFVRVKRALGVLWASKGGGGGWWLGGQRQPKLDKTVGWGGVRPVVSGHGSYPVRAVWRPPALGHHMGLGACCSRRHGGRDVTIVSREHVWQDSTDLTIGHHDLILRPRRRSSPALAPALVATMEHGRHHPRT